MAESKLMKKAPHADLTYKIIGAAMSVHRKLGPGHGEKIYQKLSTDYGSGLNGLK